MQHKGTCLWGFHGGAFWARESHQILSDCSFCQGLLSYQTILRGLPQGSVLSPTLFNINLDNLYSNARLHNYPDDNTLAYFSNTAPNLNKALEEEAGVVLTWLKENQMIANLDKFHALVIKKIGQKILWNKRECPEHTNQIRRNSEAPVCSQRLLEY